MNDYLQPIFEALYREDGLCVLARGLGTRQLFSKFVQAYAVTSSPSKRRIVICLNVLGEDEAIRDTLRASGVTESSAFPTLVTSDILSGDRSIMYQKGGVFIASSRIIINDMLKGIVDPKTICGFLIYDAHKIRETSIESFILRVFRQNNRDGFVKAFSDEPEKILGFGKTERILQLLFIKQLFLWPRFHHTINISLKRTQPEVIELSQPLSPSMITVQSSILVAMETILKELKRSNSKLDPAALTLENGVFHSFSDSIKAQLEPEWHQLTFATKQLIADLKTLRQLLDSLIRYDAITFYAYLLTIQESGMSSTIQSPSLWLTSSVAHNIFKCSKERVLQAVAVSDDAEGNAALFSVAGRKLVPVLEVPPKWKLVKEVLEEIKTDYRKKRSTEKEDDIYGGRIVLIVKDDRSLLQVRDFLSAGNNGNNVLENRLRQFVTQQASHIRQQLRGSRGGGKGSSGSGRGGGGGVGGKGGGTRVKGGRRSSKWSSATERAGCGVGSSIPTFASAPITDVEFDRLSLENKLLMMFEKELHSIPFGGVYPSRPVNFVKESNLQPSEETKGFHKRLTEDIDDSALTAKKKRTSDEFIEETMSDEDPDVLRASILDPSLHITLLTHSQCVDAASPLIDLMPSYIILLDPEVTIIRMIETYQAEVFHQYGMSRQSTKVFFLIYQESIEEHRYGVSLKHEKRAFEDLINKKSHMVVTLPDISAIDESSHASSESLLDSRSRRQLVSNANSVSRVVVDIREFGSSLPSLLHLNHIQIFPVTLLICIERKGISDLFQSFASGRLYSQAEAMSRYYDLPCLLIEFSEKNSFSLQNQSDIPSEIQLNNICSKMSLLAMAFPNLRMLWSRSPHATVDIFKTLKQNFEEADVDRAIQIGLDGISSGDGETDSNLCDTIADNIHMTVNDILLSLPGINLQNCRKVTDNVESIAHLSSMSVEMLTPLIGPMNAKKLYAFFQNSI